jgi:hypothetical protein
VMSCIKMMLPGRRALHVLGSVSVVEEENAECDGHAVAILGRRRHPVLQAVRCCAHCFCKLSMTDLGATHVVGVARFSEKFCHIRDELPPVFSGCVAEEAPGDFDDLGHILLAELHDVATVKGLNRWFDSRFLIFNRVELLSLLFGSTEELRFWPMVVANP